MLNRSPEGIILDFDGVILDSSVLKTNAFIEFYSKFPKVFDEMKTFHFKNKGLSRNEQFEYLCRLLNIESSQDQLNNYSREFSRIVMEKIKLCSFINGATDFLKNYYQDIPLHIASNAPHDELLHIINERNLSKYFFSINGLIGGRSKKMLLHKIMKENNYNSLETLYIGDTLSDYNVAKEIGLIFCGIKNSLVKFPQEVVSFKNMEEVNNYLAPICNRSPFS